MALHKLDAKATSVTLYGPEDVFQQEAFIWHLREDIWAGVTDEETRLSLSERLRSDFQPSLAPAERALPKLKQFLVDATDAVKAAEWSDSNHQAEQDGMTAFRLNPLLAFYLQLEWMYDVFKDLPGASVSIQ